MDNSSLQWNLFGVFFVTIEKQRRKPEPFLKSTFLFACGNLKKHGSEPLSCWELTTPKEHDMYCEVREPYGSMYWLAGVLDVQTKESGHTAATLITQARGHPEEEARQRGS